MLDMRQVLAVRRESRRVAGQQVVIDSCPCCRAAGAELLFNSNDHANNIFVARGLAQARYSLCHQCGTVFAAVRSTPQSAQAYYDLFTKTQNARYDVYPPANVNSKQGTARAIAAILDEAGLLRPGMAALHVRCDVGDLLDEIRRRVPDAALHGLDYFDTHVRYTRERGFAASPLHPGNIEIPSGETYDLIVSNHQLTHAFEPREYLTRICAALKPGGHIFFYNETDHDLLFDPDSKHYRRYEVVNYHKQLFVMESFESTLSEAGLDFEFLGRRNATLMYAARRSTRNATRMPVAPAAIERQRRRIQAWQKVLRRRRPAAALVHSLRWLARPHAQPDHI